MRPRSRGLFRCTTCRSAGSHRFGSVKRFLVQLGVRFFSNCSSLTASCSGMIMPKSNIISYIAFIEPIDFSMPLASFLPLFSRVERRRCELRVVPVRAHRHNLLSRAVESSDTAREVRWGGGLYLSSACSSRKIQVSSFGRHRTLSFATLSHSAVDLTPTHARTPKVDRMCLGSR